METDRVAPTSTAIMEAVTSFYGVSREQLLSPSRLRGLVRARQMAMYLMRNLTPLSLEEIAKEMGRTNHTTVMHGYERMAARITDDELRLEVRLITEFWRVRKETKST